MELSRESRIVRWAYYLDKHVPARVSLCALFWRAVLITPVKTAVTAVFVVVLSPIWVPTWAFSKYAAPPINAWLERYTDRAAARRLAKLRAMDGHLQEPSAWQVLIQGAKAVKSKVCPLVTIRRDDGMSNAA